MYLCKSMCMCTYKYMYIDLKRTIFVLYMHVHVHVHVCYVYLDNRAQRKHPCSWTVAEALTLYTVETAQCVCYHYNQTLLL